MTKGEENVVIGPDGQPLSKKALKKQAKDQEKAAKKASRQTADDANKQGGDTEVDVSEGHYGKMPMLQSFEKVDRKLLRVKDLTSALSGQQIWLRGRLHTSRSKGELLRYHSVCMSASRGHLHIPFLSLFQENNVFSCCVSSSTQCNASWQSLRK